MKLPIAIALSLAMLFVSGYTMADGTGWDFLYGEWREKNIPKEGGVRTVIVFEKARITITGPQGKEVWTVVEGSDLMHGLVVERDGKREKTSSMVKFNEMGFRLGERRWLCSDKGSDTCLNIK